MKFVTVITLALLFALLPGLPGTEWSLATSAAQAQAPQRTRLTVWASRYDTDSLQFFRDYESNSAFRAQIDARYVLWVIDLDTCGILCPRPVRRVPTFRAADVLIEGYRGPQDLTARLRLTPTPAADPAPPEPASGSSQWRPTTSPAPSHPSQQPPANSQPPASEVELGEAAPFEPLPPLDPPEGRQQQGTSVTTDPDKPATSGGADHSAAASTANSQQPPATSQQPRRGIAGWFRTALFVFNLTHPGGQAATMLTLVTGVATWFIARRRPKDQSNDTSAATSAPRSTFCKRCSSLEARLASCQADARRQTEQLTSQIDQLTSQIDQLTIEREQLTKTKTETHYVEVPVSDQEGEAYKEACRRVAQTSPQATPVVRTIEATAQQILHGTGVLRKESKAGREATTANPGLYWRD